jgi:hypothetical protein
MAVRRVSDHYSEPEEQQPENGLALALGPAQVLCLVMVDGTGGAAIEAAPGTVVEFVGVAFRRQCEVFRYAGRELELLIQSGFEVAEALFLRSGVAGKWGGLFKGSTPMRGDGG